MSEIDRAELRRLLDAATPRPWWQEWVEGDEWYAVYGQPTGDLVCPEVCTAGDADDTNLLVAAVNALPGLLGALEKTEGHRDKLAFERAIERVRALHVRGDEWCGYHNSALCECANVYCDECGAEWPCPTIQALDGDE